MSAESLTKWTARHYNDHLASVVAGLRRLADEIEREGRPRDHASFDGTPRYANASRQALHSLHWGIANLSADRLIADAAQADAAERADA